MERKENKALKSHSKKSKFYFVPPIIVRKIFNRFYWETNCNKILLTFDDGPNPATTDKILRILDKAKIKAIFFAVGKNLQRNPQLAKTIIQEGHTLGNHTWSHNILTKISNAKQIEVIEKVQNYAYENFNYQIKYFRPPHGKFPLSLSKTLSRLGLTNIMWSLLTYDFENNFDIVKFAIDNFLKQNSIVVFHDSNKSAAIIEDGLKYLIETAENKGFEFGKIDECLK